MNAAEKIEQQTPPADPRLALERAVGALFGHGSVVSGVHPVEAVREAFRDTVEAAHEEALSDNAVRDQRAQAEAAHQARMAAKPLAQRHSALQEHVFSTIETAAPGLLKVSQDRSWAETSHAERWKRLRVVVHSAVGAPPYGSRARIDLVSSSSGQTFYRFPVKDDGSFNVKLLVQRLRGEA